MAAPTDRLLVTKAKMVWTPFFAIVTLIQPIQEERLELGFLVVLCKLMRLFLIGKGNWMERNHGGGHQMATNVLGHNGIPAPCQGLVKWWWCVMLKATF